MQKLKKIVILPFCKISTVSTSVRLSSLQKIYINYVHNNDHITSCFAPACVIHIYFIHCMRDHISISAFQQWSSITVMWQRAIHCSLADFVSLNKHPPSLECGAVFLASTTLIHFTCMWVRACLSLHRVTSQFIHCLARSVTRPRGLSRACGLLPTWLLHTLPWKKKQRKNTLQQRENGKNISFSGDD